MFCSNCGNQVDEKAVICVKCGHKLTTQIKNSGTSEFVMYLPLILGIASIVLCGLGIVCPALSVISIVMTVVLKKKEGKEAASKHLFGVAVTCSIIGIVIQIILALVFLGVIALPIFFMEKGIYLNMFL